MERTEEANINPTHSFDVADAIKYGSIEKALLVKEVRGMQVYKLRNGGTGWVYYSAQALTKKFPYMSARSIDRWLKELIDDRVFDSDVRNKVKYDRTKSYKLRDLPESVNGFAKVTAPFAKMANDISQNGEPIPSHSLLLHTSLKENNVTDTVDNSDNRERPSPAKERIKQALSTGDLSLLKQKPD